MVLIPGGHFLMGVDKEVNVDTKKMSQRQKLRYAVSREAFHDEGPAHNVIIDAFFIDQYEVSNKHYGEFLKASGHPSPAYWDDHRRNKPQQPVSGVNWNDANAFCSWANKRLPTEAEWEKPHEVRRVLNTLGAINMTRAWEITVANKNSPQM